MSAVTEYFIVQRKLPFNKIMELRGGSFFFLNKYLLLFSLRLFSCRTTAHCLLKMLRIRTYYAESEIKILIIFRYTEQSFGISLDFMLTI